MKQTHFTQQRLHRTPALGFTLTELLVVIVIIVVLAAISITVTSSIRTRAKQTKSLGNLKQLSVLHQMYVSENNGKMVPGKSMDSEGKKKEWYCHLAAQLVTDRSIDGPWSFFNFNPFKMKPELDFFQIPNPFPPDMAGGYWNFGYGLNMQPGLPETAKQNTEEGWGGNFRMDAISEPSRRIMIAEWPAWNMYADKIADIKKYAAAQKKTLRAVYFDGHCEALTPEQVRKAYTLK